MFANESSSKLTRGPGSHWVLPLGLAPGGALRPDLTAEGLFGYLIQPNQLESLFWSRVAPKTSRGIDRVSPKQFAAHLPARLESLSGKLATGRFRFSPYLEILRLKGRGQLPRAIAVATVRDRLVLQVLREILNCEFGESVPRRLPNEYVRLIQAPMAATTGLRYAKLDIKSFYDSIPQRPLLERLSARLPRLIVRLIERAMRNPSGTHESASALRRKLNPIGVGVPQGLPISNILAELYLAELDRVAVAQDCKYFRYVDDILLIGPRRAIGALEGIARRKLSLLGLQVSETKVRRGRLAESFEYLGYEVSLPRISVRKSTTARFLNSLAADFATFRHVADARYRQPWMTPQLRKELFLEELNERIGGAVSENRRYGWIFYFIEVNDVGLLRQLDRVVAGLWRRTFGEEPTPRLKRFVRALYEARYNQFGPYVHNYNRYTTIAERLAFLTSRQLIGPGSQLTDKDVAQLFEEARGRSLGRLEMDVGRTS